MNEHRTQYAVQTKCGRLKKQKATKGMSEMWVGDMRPPSRGDGRFLTQLVRTACATRVTISETQTNPMLRLASG